MLHIQTANIERVSVTPEMPVNPSVQDKPFREFSWDDVHVDIPVNRHFVLDERLGSGTTSTVYKATHPFHGSAAVKVIKPIYADYVPTELDFLRRIQGSAHIIRVFDAWNVDDNWFIATELMHGTLLDRMKDGMSVADIRDAAGQIAAALVFLHARDIIHFDLKPENIGYVTQTDGRVIYKLIDFGAAEFLADVQSSEFQYGVHDHTIVKTSKWYRAYELFGFSNEHPMDITDKVDVWSLGCILFEMLSEEPLFENLENSNDLDINKKTIIDGWFATAQYVSTAPSAEHAELAMLALECLTHNVTKRPNSFTVFIKVLGWDAVM
jgi:serine/threonine protein kinase